MAHKKPTAVWMYVQHLLGTGHLRRTLTLARALGEAGIAVRVVSGGMPLADLNTADLDFVQLPPVRVADAAFGEWLDPQGRAVDKDREWRQQRCRALLQSLRTIEPRLLIIETFPFGRRAFHFELLPLLEYARGLPSPPSVVCSVRDIVQSARKPQRIAEATDWANRYLDAVWVHGDPNFVRFEESFGSLDALKPPLAYTGYLYKPAAVTVTDTAPDHIGHDEIVVSAGGGPAGFALFKAALESARNGAGGGRRWRILLGAHYDRRRRAELTALGSERSIIEPAGPIFPLLLQRCAVSVSRAGYNTVLDLLHHRTRAVLAPLEDYGETEQLQRALALERWGRATVLRQQELSAPTLTQAVERALEGAVPLPSAVRMDGVEECVRLAGEV